MALSVGGLASGLDTTNIISKLIELERKPVTLLENKKNTLDTQFSSWQDVNKKLYALETAVNAINKKSEFIGVTSSFANNNSLSTQTVLTATASSSAASGTYTIKVSSLAKAEKEVSQGFSSTSSTLGIGVGTLTITVGSKTTRIDVNSSNNTLDGIKTAINNSNAGVTASIINDGSSYRLSITGTATGADNKITIQDNLQGGFAGLPLFSWTKSQSASNASIELDGISISKSSNVVTDVIDGVTLNLQSAGSGAITFASDTSKVKQNILNFVNAYNDVLSFIKDQFTYDTNKKTTGGPLFGNNTLMSIQQKLRGIVSDAVPGLSGSYTYLSQIGIRTGEDGRLSINDSELSDALRNDYSGVSKLFTEFGSSTDTNVTYVTHSEKTKGGTYEVRVSGGVVQLRKSGTSAWHDATGSGNYWTGGSGYDEEGLKVSLNSLSNGSYGSVTVSLGVAEQLTTDIKYLTDKSYKGLIFAEEEDIQKRTKDVNDQIDGLNLRINKKEEGLKRKFTSLEVVMSKLQSQGSYLNQQLTNLNNVSAARRR
ncbi:MAG: flagellar filament capping protein FliD [Nitrospinae bacterium]|nr:flagellar filament capping protein FliD [Nitrospinota bacterium]